MEEKAAIYCRLSQDDGSVGESGSIQTQRTLLTQYCKEQHIRITDYYCDDGWSGTNFERPEFQRMLEDIENGKINTVVVKDLSRFGRENTHRWVCTLNTTSSRKMSASSRWRRALTLQGTGQSGAALHQCYQLVLCAAGIYQNESRTSGQSKKRNVYGQPCAVRLSERPQ